MKINPKYVVKNLFGETLIIPTGDAKRDFTGMISANEVASFTWQNMEECETPEDMVQLVRGEFEVEEETVHSSLLLINDDFSYMNRTTFCSFLISYKLC